MSETDRAVAPVVGIALLIGISVILAGVIGSIIFGLTADPSDSPQASLSFSVDGSGTVEVNHESGERLETDEIVIKDQNSVIDQFNVGEIVAGETVATNVTNANNYDKISVVWQDPTSDAENILATFEP